MLWQYLNTLHWENHQALLVTNLCVKINIFQLRAFNFFLSVAAGNVLRSGDPLRKWGWGAYHPEGFRHPPRWSGGSARFWLIWRSAPPRRSTPSGGSTPPTRMLWWGVWLIETVADTRVSLKTFRGFMSRIFKANREVYNYRYLILILKAQYYHAVLYDIVFWWGLFSQFSGKTTILPKTNRSWHNLSGNTST